MQREHEIELHTQRLQQNDPNVRYEAVRSLCAIGDVTVVAPLRKALRDPEWYIRALAAEGLTKFGNMVSIVPLFRVLRDEDYHVRVRAAEALGNTGDVRAIGPLCRALGDVHRSVRESVADALVQFGNAAVFQLSASLKNDNLNVQIHAVRALGRIGNAIVSADLCELLGDRHPRRLREEAAGALMAMCPASVVPMFPVLEQWDVSVRVRTIELLGRMGQPVAAEPLGLVLQRSQHPEIVAAVAEALIRIGPEGLPGLCHTFRIPTTEIFEPHIQEVMRQIGVAAIFPLCETVQMKERFIETVALTLLQWLYHNLPLPRAIFTTDGIDAPQRYAMLQALKNVKRRNWYGTRAFQFDIGDIRAICEYMLAVPEAQQSAREVLTHVDAERLVRPSERDPETEQNRLVRPAEGPGEAISTQLVRASDEPAETPEPPKRWGWWKRKD